MNTRLLTILATIYTASGAEQGNNSDASQRSSYHSFLPLTSTGSNNNSLATEFKNIYPQSDSYGFQEDAQSFSSEEPESNYTEDGDCEYDTEDEGRKSCPDGMNLDRLAYDNSLQRQSNLSPTFTTRSLDNQIFQPQYFQRQQEFTPPTRETSSLESILESAKQRINERKKSNRSLDRSNEQLVGLEQNLKKHQSDLTDAFKENGISPDVKEQMFGVSDNGQDLLDSIQANSDLLRVKEPETTIDYEKVNVPVSKPVEKAQDLLTAIFSNNEKLKVVKPEISADLKNILEKAKEPISHVVEKGTDLLKSVRTNKDLLNTEKPENGVDLKNIVQKAKEPLSKVVNKALDLHKTKNVDDDLIMVDNPLAPPVAEGMCRISFEYNPTSKSKK